MNKAKLMDNLQKVIDESSKQISVNNIAAWKYLNEAHDQLECSKAISDEMNEENDGSNEGMTSAVPTSFG